MHSSMSAVLHPSSSRKSSKCQYEIITNENSQKVPGNRRSAVERLEETKANYVKTERVLDCKQNFEHSSNLHVSTGPQIDALLKGHIKSIYNCQNIAKFVHSINLPENKNNVPSNDFPPNSCSTNFPRCQLQGNSVLEKKKVFQSDSCELLELPNAQSHLRSTNAGKCRLPYVLQYDPPGLNENIPTTRVTYPTGQIEDDSFVFQIDSSDDRAEKEHSDYEQISIGASEDSSSMEEGQLELELKKQNSKTSDYVSRSSSFKCSLKSDRVKNLVASFESRMNAPIPKMSSADEKTKLLSRSKSDKSCRFTITPEHNRSTDAELEHFFNTMGLEATLWQSLAAPTESPVHFFDSISSLNSDDHLSNAASEESAFEEHKEGLTNSDLKKHAPTETSIVEKNARIVKWLYNCRSASKINTS